MKPSLEDIFKGHRPTFIQRCSKPDGWVLLDDHSIQLLWAKNWDLLAAILDRCGGWRNEIQPETPEALDMAEVVEGDSQAPVKV